MGEASIRERIFELAEKKPPLTRAEIAEAVGRSVGRVCQVLNGPPNPKGDERTYTCARCSVEFVSRSVNPPRRCPPSQGGCGSHYWRTPK